MKLRKSIRLGKDGFPHGAGGESTLRGFLDDENDLAHGRK
jgi:hypothetical protein